MGKVRPWERTESEKISLKDFEIIEKVKKFGCEILPEFKVEKETEQYYIDLIKYFTAKEGNLDPKKGLLICGNVGTGKTLSMKLMRHIFKNFNIINTRYVVRDFFAEEIPTKIIDKYGRNSYFKTPTGGFNKEKPITICFDDFGLENVNVKNYGNEQNILEEIILDRYDEYLAHGMRTFATTNLTAKMIEECYGSRVRDRLREMMNYVTLDGKSKRK